MSAYHVRSRVWTTDDDPWVEKDGKYIKQSEMDAFLRALKNEVGKK